MQPTLEQRKKSSPCERATALDNDKEEHNQSDDSEYALDEDECRREVIYVSMCSSRVVEPSGFRVLGFQV